MMDWQPLLLGSILGWFAHVVFIDAITFILKRIEK